MAKIENPVLRFLHKHHIAIHLVSLFVVVAALAGMYISTLRASNLISASDVLGQLTPTPNYTRSFTQISSGTTSYSFNQPFYSAVDSTNNRLYVSDGQNNRILVYNLNNSDKTPIDYVADYVLGQSNFVSSDSSIAQNRLSEPLGISLDISKGLLYVADYSANRVVVFDVRNASSGSQTLCGTATTGIATGMNASCVIGQSNFTTGIYGTTQNKLHGPTAPTYDAATQRLYVADDLNHRVVTFDTRAEGSGSQSLCGTSSTGIATNMNASCVLGQGDFVTGTVGNTQSTFRNPWSTVVDPTNQLLYVADYDNNRVLAFDVRAEGSGSQSLCGTSTTGIAIGMNASCVLGQTNFTNRTTGLSQSEMFRPVGLSMKVGSSMLFVADYVNNRVLTFDVRTSGVPQTLCGTTTSGIANGMNASCVIGQNNFTSNGNSASGLYNPAGVFYNLANDHLYVSEQNNNRVTIYNIANMTANGLAPGDVVGQVTISYTYALPLDYASNVPNSGTPSNINATGFETPSSTALDTVDHRLFTVDTTNNRILIFNLDTNNNLLDHTADNVLGQTDMISGNGAITQAKISSPKGILYNSNTGLLFVVNAYRVSVFDARTSGSSSRTLCSTSTTGITDGMNASCVLGQANFTANSSTTNASTLSLPTSLAYDTTNNLLFVTDRSHNRVLAFDVNTNATAQNFCGVITNGIANGMNASCVLGQANFTSGAVPAGPDEYSMYWPEGIAYDNSSKRLFVSDSSQNRVLIFDLSNGLSNYMAASNVIGQNNFGTNSSGTTASRFPYPTGLAYESNNKVLYVVDYMNNRVLAFDTATITNGESAVAVFGQPDFVTATSGTTNDKFTGPTDVTFDEGNNRAYIADRDNNRILIFNLIQLTTASLPGTSLNANYNQTLSIVNDRGTVSYGSYSGSLPTGLAYTASGIAGNPTAPGVYSFITRAIDTIGPSTFYSNQKSYTLTILNSGGGEETPSCTDPRAINYQAQSACDYAPPTITITVPTSASTYPTTVDTIAIGGTANDNDLITSITYITNGSTPVSVVGTASWTIPALSLVPGPNTVTVTAYNNHNKQSTDTLTIIYTPNTITPTCATDPTLPGCGQVDPPIPICSDGLDNDGDNLIDTTDPGCNGPNDESENNPPIVQLCQDPDASNYQGPLPCVPVPQNDNGGDSVDVCSNVPGDQATMPTGWEASSVAGECVTRANDPVDSNTGGNFHLPEITVSAPVVNTTKTFGGIGVLIGAITGILGMFGGALTISEIALIPIRFWTLLMGILGFRKREQRWGVVFDAVTKQPLDPVYVSLVDANGKEVATAITDIDGRYGFLVTPGTYRITVNKTNYLFPSQKLSKLVTDSVYNDLYFGDYFEITDSKDVITKNIPMDPEHFDWNEFVKNQKKLTKWNARRAIMLNALATVLFWGGFGCSLVALYFSVTAYTITIALLYVLLFILRQFVLKKPSFGMVSAKGEPMPFGLVRIYSSKLGTLLFTRVLDKYGRYYALAPKGTYVAAIEEKKDDQSYQAVHTTHSFEANNGVINKKFKI